MRNDNEPNLSDFLSESPQADAEIARASGLKRRSLAGLSLMCTSLALMFILNEVSLPQLSWLCLAVLVLGTVLLTWAGFSSASLLSRMRRFRPQANLGRAANRIRLFSWFFLILATALAFSGVSIVLRIVSMLTDTDIQVSISLYSLFVLFAVSGVLIVITGLVLNLNIRREMEKLTSYAENDLV